MECRKGVKTIIIIKKVSNYYNTFPNNTCQLDVLVGNISRVVIAALSYQMIVHFFLSLERERGTTRLMCIIHNMHLNYNKITKRDN